MGCRTIPHPPYVFTMIPVDPGHTWATWGSNVSNPTAPEIRHDAPADCSGNLQHLHFEPRSASLFGWRLRIWGWRFWMILGILRDRFPLKIRDKHGTNLKTRPVSKTTSELLTQPLIFDEATGPPGWGSNLLWDVCEVQTEVSPRGQCWRWCGDEVSAPGATSCSSKNSANSFEMFQCVAPTAAWCFQTRSIFITVHQCSCIWINVTAYPLVNIQKTMENHHAING